MFVEGPSPGVGGKSLRHQVDAEYVLLAYTVAHMVAQAMYGVENEEVASGLVWILDKEAKMVCDDFCQTLEECWSYGLRRAVAKMKCTKQAQVSPPLPV
eukprot:1469671-Pyramimonas_sp.AAC.1